MSATRGPTPTAPATTLRLSGTVPPEVWNRIGIKLLPKLRTGKHLSVGIDLSVTVDPHSARNVESDLRQALDDLGIADRLRIETRTEGTGATG